MKAKCTIKGVSAILMHRFPLEGTDGIEKKKPTEQCEIFAYRDGKSGELYIPSVNLWRSLLGGASYLKGKGRGTLKKNAAACLAVEPDVLLLGTKHFEIDSRAIVNPSTGGRIVRHRPRLNSWQVSFDVLWDDTLLSEKEVRSMIELAGQRVGVLDYRPENNGPFGRYKIESWIC